MESDGGDIVPPQLGEEADVNSWRKVDPAVHEDVLPQPYRFINKWLTDELLWELDRKLDILEARRKSEEYESGLQTLAATDILSVAGRVTCACSEAKPGNNFLAVGTSHGEVVLIDTAHKSAKAVAQKGVVPHSEPLHCVALSSEGSFQPPPLPKLPGIDRDELLFNRPEMPRKSPKIVAVGKETPRIFVFEIRKETFGVELVPSCCVEVPPAPQAAQDDAAPPVEQLHVQGSMNGCVWVLVLLPDRTVNAYLIPLADRSVGDAQDRRGSVADQTIKEEEDEEEGGGENDQNRDEFKDVLHIKTPTYRFPLPDLAPLAGLPEPSLNQVMLSLMMTRPEGGGRGGVAQVPAFCFVAASTSNAVCVYSLKGRPAPCAAKGLTYEQLLKEIAPPMNEVADAVETKTLRPHRRLTLPSQTSCTASSVGGGIFAVGGEHGAVALISIGAGPGLTTMLPGHYGAVVALAFYRDVNLVSVGADSWVHHYCMKTNQILARHLCTPPPSPPPGQAVVVGNMAPVALTLDAGGHLRLVDLRVGKKMARASCTEEEDPDAPPLSSTQSMPGAPVAGHGETHKLVATGSCFCVLRETTGAAPLPAEAVAAEPAEAAGEAAPADTATEANTASEDFSTLFFFESAKAPSVPKPESMRHTVTVPESPEVQTLHPESVVPSLAGTRKSMMTQKSGATSLQGKGTQGKGDQRQANQIVELTTENLRMLGKTGLVQAAGATGNSAMQTQSSPNGQTRASAGAIAGAQRAHRVPETWQAGVRRQLRAAAVDRGVRNSRLNKRMDQLRKELEENARVASVTIRA